MAVGTLVFDRVVVPQRRVPRAHPGRGRPQDEQAPRQHPRADPADGRARRRRACAGSWSCSGSPWSSRRVGHKVLDEIASKVIRTYWSVASFQSLYARANDWTPGSAAGERDAARSLGAVAGASAGRRGRRRARDVRHRAGRQGARRLHRRPVQLVRAALAAPVLGRRPGRAGRRCTSACDVLTRLLAPFVPFVTERVWERAVRRRRARHRLGAPRVVAGRRRDARATPTLDDAGRAGPAAGRARPRRPCRVRR